MTQEEETLTIRAMCDAFGVTARALRFYESKELLAPIRIGQKRLYTRRDRARLKLILRGKRFGFSLEEIRQLLDLYDPSNQNAVQMTETIRLGRVHLAEMVARRAALDEAIALPTDFSARIARNTQLYLQQETQITRTVDPWAGSYYVESLTHEIAHKAWSLIQEVESLGGMTKAIEAGIPKLRIEEAAAKKQARIDSGQDKIIGVNTYRLQQEDPLQILDVDNQKVRAAQLERLAQVKQQRNAEKVAKALKDLTGCAESGQGNLLALAVVAARERATLGEISDALEAVYGRFKAQIKSFSGVYSKEIKKDPSFEKARQLANQFAELEGRRPRIMIAKMGQDGHDRGAKVVATGYADVGFDVDIGPLFQTPAESAKQAVENDVHILGVSSLAAGHKTLVPQVIAELKKYGREDIMVIVGGVIPAQDYQFLFDAGAVAVYGPGTRISDAAIELFRKAVDDRC